MEKWQLWAWHLRTLIAIAATLCFAPLSHAENNVTIFAASSLTGVLDETFSQRESEGVRVDLSYSGSGTIVRQIEAGAPADIFISANTQWIDYLEEQGKLDPASRRTLALNDLVLVAPGNSKLPALSPYHLLQHQDVRRIAIGETRSVPAGIYGRETLERFGLWAKLKPRLLPADSVRNVLAWVERGEADLAFVYKSDVMDAQHLRVMHIFRPSLRAGIKPAHYTAAILKGRSTREVEEAYGFLFSEQVRKTLSDKGFDLPPLQQP